MRRPGRECGEHAAERDGERDRATGRPSEPRTRRLACVERAAELTSIVGRAHPGTVATGDETAMSVSYEPSKRTGSSTQTSAPPPGRFAACAEPP